jgi:hypothetical protein
MTSHRFHRILLASLVLTVSSYQDCCIRGIHFQRGLTSLGGNGAAQTPSMTGDGSDKINDSTDDWQS